MTLFTVIYAISCIICFVYSVPIPAHSTTTNSWLDDTTKELLFNFISSLNEGAYPHYQSINSLECDVCKKIVDVIIADASSRKVFNDDLLSFMTSSCIEILSLEYDGKAICPNLTKFYGPIIWYSIVNSEFSSESVCQHLYICPKKEEYVSWIPQTPLEPNYRITKPNSPVLPKSNTNDASVIKFLHISDFHLDLAYKQGAPSTCEFFLCCHASMTGSNPAGTYGAYGCDLPMTTADLVLNHLGSLQGIDFVVYGGDNPPHDMWVETEESQMVVEALVIKMFKQHFPNTPIYPVLGNHESYPESEYLQSLYMNLTETLARMWSSWAHFPASALKSMGHGGYYSVIIKPKLRLISYNSDYGYLPNFYTMLNHKNPAYGEHTKWLQETLTDAKKNGEKVLLVAHVPPGIGTAITEYGEWFINATRPFSDIIVGQLFGHTHQDHFKVVQQNGKPFGSILITPSITTFAHQNPSFRIYSMDPTTYEILDYEQHFLNLSKANALAKEGKTPQFELNYSAKKLYGMKDLSPDSWWGLVNRFKTNSTLLLQYVDNMYARSKVPSCNAPCKKMTICECEYTSYLDALECSSN